jgi:hypothetical protein
MWAKGGEPVNYSDFEKVREEMGTENVNQLLSDGWEILSIAPGSDENGAHFLYCLGWRDPIDRLGF